MKISRLALLTLAVGALLPLSVLIAEGDKPAATPSVSAPASTAKDDTEEAKEGTGAQRARFAALSLEEQKKLRAARKAARKDPAVIAALPNRKTDRKGYQETLRAAMIKADPSVEAILEKLKTSRRAQRKAGV